MHGLRGEGEDGVGSLGVSLDSSRDIEVGGLEDGVGISLDLNIEDVCDRDVVGEGADDSVKGCVEKSVDLRADSGADLGGDGALHESSDPCVDHVVLECGDVQ